MPKPSDETYRDMGIDPATVREANTKRHREGALYAEERERLREKWNRIHHRDCKTFRDHRIPLESCDCNRRFLDECEASRARLRGAAP